MKLWLIRHGMTKGNQEHRYVGITDESILPEEWERLEKKADSMKIHPSIVFVSPARRCRETAMCLFPELRRSVESEYAADAGGAVTAIAIMAQAPVGLQRISGNGNEKADAQKMTDAGASRLIVIPEFMEMSFGAFEYKTYEEINADPDPAHRAAYQRYIDSNGETAFPGGESKAEFTKRVCDGFERAVLPRIQALMKATNASVASETKAGMEPELAFKPQEHRSAEDALLEIFDAGDETIGLHTLREDGSAATSSALERSPSDGAPSIAIVAHGGTIMALMERYAEPKKSYFEWSVKPGEGYRLDVTYRS